MNSFGTQIIRALDGTGGGSYTLAAPLSIDGDTVTIETLEASNISMLDALGTLTVYASVGLKNDVAIGTISADTLSVASTATFSAPVSFNGDVNLGNAGTDLSTLAGILGFTGTGRVQTTGTAHPNADTNPIDIASSRYNTAAPAASAKNYTLTCTNEADGDWFVFYNAGSTQNVLLAGLVTTILVPQRGVFYLRIAGVWTLMNAWVSV
jgi:hypothetical protein